MPPAQTPTRRSALLIVTSDPRRSHRPAEAIRIAAGVGAWQQVDIALYLHGPAVLALAENTGELVEDENFPRYLPVAQQTGRPIYVQARAAELTQLRGSPWRFQPLDDAEFAALAARSDCLLHF